MGTEADQYLIGSKEGPFRFSEPLLKEWGADYYKLKKEPVTWADADETLGQLTDYFRH